MCTSQKGGGGVSFFGGHIFSVVLKGNKGGGGRETGVLNGKLKGKPTFIFWGPYFKTHPNGSTPSAWYFKVNQKRHQPFYGSNALISLSPVEPVDSPQWPFRVWQGSFSSHAERDSSEGFLGVLVPAEGFPVVAEAPERQQLWFVLLSHRQDVSNLGAASILLLRGPTIWCN